MDDASLDQSSLLAADRPGDNAAPLSVSELSIALKRHVEGAFGHVRLRGEISGWKRAASGHAYLALKDMDAVLDAVIWKGVMNRIAFAPADGVEVIATGKLTIYPGRSKYQLVIESMEIAGEGALLALLEATKKRLVAEGLFDASRKRALPFMPHTIGVVTSPTGAVIRDILHRLADRCPTRVIVWPVLVQGVGAAEQVAAAVHGFSELCGEDRPDLIIVARGGGSVEDLWAFNEEQVVRAVASCSIPIISAVGHETDTTLCDFAADIRAPTPTAAAEMAVPVRAELLAGLSALSIRALRAAYRHQERAAERLTTTARRLPVPDSLFGPKRQYTDDLGGRLSRGLSHRLTQANAQLSYSSAALRPALLMQLFARRSEQFIQLKTKISPSLFIFKFSNARSKIDALWRIAQSYHPDKPLQRGYARVGAKSGGVVSTAQAARAAKALTLYFTDGEVDTIVDIGSGQTKVEPRAKPRYSHVNSDQPKLF
jgi:exodeoxyribonuclease VII large subunit